MNFSFQKLFLLSLLAGLSFLTSCVDTEIDPPPVTGDELEVQGNTTIAELKALYIPGRLTTIEEDIIVQGVVVGNDAGGNFFRSLIVQDSTAGIEVRINLTDAFNLYPLGREIAIDCRGLVLGEFNGIIQLGGYIYTEGGGEELGDIVDFNQRIYRGMIVTQPITEGKTINQLGTADVSTLVRLEGLQFSQGELGLTYADAFGRQTLNRTLEDCDGNTIVLRTSGFADFANDTLPEGNGVLTAVYNVFGDTKQLFIRDTRDVQFTGNRCGAGTGEEELMTIAELRQVYADGGTAAPDNRKISGVVISDGNSGNFQGRNMVIQDATAGIVVRFQNDHNFALGEEVEIVVSGQELSEFNFLLQMNNVSLVRAVSKGTGTVTPRVATVNDVLENAELWESTLVELSNVTISGSATFAFSTTVSDGTDNIDLFTSPGASFADTPVPAEPVEKMVAIVSQFSQTGPADAGYQLIIRNLDDVGIEDGGGGGSGDPELISLAELRTLFEGGATAAPANSFITAVVISDKDAQNTTGRNAVVQDETGGIAIRFNDFHEFSLGEEIEINVSGLELSEFNGLLQVNNVPNGDALSNGPGTQPEPREATIQEILDNAEAWESTLVKIVDIEFTEGGSFSGAKTLQDPTGSIATFTRNDASFAGASVPDGTFTLTAMVSAFNSPQLTIRNLNDIEQ
jgi:hypothetical protein